MALPQLSPDMGFDDAANLVVEYLTEHVPLALWSVTRVENDRQTFLYMNEGNSYHMSKGGGTLGRTVTAFTWWQAPLRPSPLTRNQFPNMQRQA